MRAVVAAAMAAVLAALAPGLAPYEAAARSAGFARSSPTAGRAPTAPGGGYRSAVLVPSLGVSLVPGAPAQSAIFSAPAADLPALPTQAPAAADVSASVPVPAAADSEASESARVQLERTAADVGSARESGAKGLLDSLFAGVRRGFGSVDLDGSGPISAASALDGTRTASGKSRAEPPSPSGRDSQGDDWIDAKGVAGMFVQRSISIMCFVLTSLAYPLVAIRAVGTADFGVLMALGPLASIATGPLNGLIADRLSPRNGVAALAVLRGALAVMLPAFAGLGVMSFWPLLLASIANGWQLSLLLTSENAYFRRMAGKNHIDNIMAGASINYFLLQVLMTLVAGVGAFIDRWNPMTPFVISAFAHVLIVAPIAWFTLPDRLPAAAAKAKAAMRSLAERAAAAKAFLGRFWKETVLLALSLGVYLFWHTPVPMSAALLLWVTRTDGFKAVWSQKDLRASMVLAALAAGATLSYQYLALPVMAQQIGGEAGKGEVLGEVLGALFFGQLIANSSQARLPSLRIPFTSLSIPAHRLIQGAVLATGAAWSFARLFPGSWPAAGAALGLGAALVFGASRFTARGWVKWLGLGLAAGSVLPLVLWGNIPVLFAGMLFLGLFSGPTAVALNAYFGKHAREASVGNAYGANSSMINATISFGYGLMSLFIGLFQPAFPGALWPIAALFLAVGAIFLVAPRLLPGLPGGR